MLRNKKREKGMSRSVATVLLGAVVLAGCMPGGGEKPKASDAAISTDVGEMGNLTLTVWDTRTSPGAKEAQDALNAAFEKKYPNVQIKRVSKQFSDFKTTLKLGLSSSNPPDVTQVNQGYGDLALFVKAGLLLDLDRYAERYKWTDRYNSALLDQNRSTPDGRSWGEGSLYGISNQAELVGLYYNKKLLASAGLKPPTNLDELQAALPKLKDAGILPIQLGTSTKSGAIHIFGLIQALTAGPDEVNDLVFGKGDRKWTAAGTVEAADTLKSWAKSGYLTEGANGQSDSDMATQFSKGKGAFMISGNWWVPQVQEALGEDAGFTVLSKSAGETPATEGGLSLMWGIPSKSKHADAAAAYIEFISSPEGEDILAAGGDLPAGPAATFEPTAGTLQVDSFSAIDKVLKAGTLLPYLDYTTTDFFNTLSGQLQELIAGRSSTAEMVKVLQSEYVSAKETR